jgi:hypothetical protein
MDCECEARVLESRPELLGFHMSGLATCTFMPNKRRQRKKNYYMAQVMLWEEAK